MILSRYNQSAKLFPGIESVVGYIDAHSAVQRPVGKTADLWSNGLLPNAQTTNYDAGGGKPKKRKSCGCGCGSSRMQGGDPRKSGGNTSTAKVMPNAKVNLTLPFNPRDLRSV